MLSSPLNQTPLFTQPESPLIFTNFSEKPNSTSRGKPLDEFDEVCSMQCQQAWSHSKNCQLCSKLDTMKNWIYITIIGILGLAFIILLAMYIAKGKSPEHYDIGSSFKRIGK